MIQVVYAVVWWLIIFIIGLIAFPLVSRVCGKLPDKGYSICKVLGLLLITYFSWLLASLHIIKFGYVNISVSIFILITLSLYFGRKEIGRIKLNLKPILVSEIIFASFFILLLVYIQFKPDIFFAYTEDFMDYAFLQSILRSEYFPPSDPWLAGASLPYYYGGQLVTAILTMISKVPSSLSYNLAMGMFFGLLASASYGIGYNITKRKLYGFIATLLVCCAGYISGIFQLSAYILNRDVLDYSAAVSQGFSDWLLHFDVGTGVIPHTENIYPYAAFLKGELHANTTTLPFQLMYIMLIFSLFKKDDESVGLSRSDSLLIISIIGVSLGFFSLINIWDYPIYAALTVLAFIFLKMNLSKRQALGVLLLSLIMYVPYFVTRSWGGTHGIGIVHIRTDLADFIELFALFLFIVIAFFYGSLRKVISLKPFILTTVLLIIIAVVSFLLDFQLLLILIPMILASLYGIYKAPVKVEIGFILVLILMGALIALFCEIFFIKDSLPPPNERYNTVMKLYLPLWVFLGIASVYGIFITSQKIKGKFKAAWICIISLFIAASLIQPLGQTIGWASGKRDYFGIGRGTLDGIAYLKTKASGDYDAIQWINNNIRGQPVILEAPGGAYQYSSRISTMTGLPTVIGWITHEVMWRGSWEMVSGRDTETNSIYNNPNSDESIAILRKYGVEYIYVGKLEKEQYPEDSLQGFAVAAQIYTLVYQNEEAEIYQVNLQ